MKRRIVLACDLESGNHVRVRLARDEGTDAHDIALRQLSQRRRARRAGAEDLRVDAIEDHLDGRALKPEGLRHALGKAVRAGHHRVGLPVAEVAQPAV